jgi:hypothetical protein
MMKRTRALAAGLGVWLSPGTAVAQAPGNEFQVNTYTTSFQSAPSIASDAAGNFMVVWASYGQDGSGTGVYARQYLPSGEAADASEFRVNTYVADNQRVPQVASDPLGQRVVVWESVQNGFGVYARRFDAMGAPSAEFPIHTHPVSAQRDPSVAMDAAGNFVVAWTDGSGAGGGDVRAQRFTAAGVPQEASFVVNSYTPGGQSYPAVAVGPSGDFIVVWASPQDGDLFGVYGQRYNRFGLALAGEFRVNTSTVGFQFEARVAMHTDGSFVVVWMGEDGSSFGVFGQRYNPNGVPLGGEFRVNSVTTYSQSAPSIALDAGGNFVVAWASQHDAGQYDVFARFYNASGTPRGTPFMVNRYTTAWQVVPVVAALPDGAFVVAWASNGQDGDDGGVFASLPIDLIFRDGFQAVAPFGGVD